MKIGMRRVLLAVVLLASACMFVTSVAAAASTTLALQAGFSPDRLGTPTSISATDKFASPTGGAPPPLSSLTFYAPAGMGVDTRGAGTCTAATLEGEGPSACPADSRAGFGEGVAVGEQSGEVLREPFTLDFFCAPAE